MEVHFILRLRNLSGGSGGGFSSPPTSPAVTGNITLKLSEYRYGHEEMLALYTGNYTVPPELSQIPSVVVNNTVPPLALHDTIDEDPVSLIGIFICSRIWRNIFKILINR